MNTKQFIIICLLSGMSYFVSAKSSAAGSNHFYTVAESNSTSSLSGNIMSAANKNPFQFAKVTLINADTKEVTGTFESLYNGYFKFSEVASGNYQIVITAEGYATVTSPVISVFSTDQKIYTGKFFMDLKRDDTAAGTR